MLNNQLSSSQINETLLNAMKIIAQKEVQNLEFDVTEKYTILEKTKDKNGETCYIVNANNIKREVYPMNNKEYYPDDVVLIQIPKNNILEKKYILGLANSVVEKYFLPESNFISFKDGGKEIINLDDEEKEILYSFKKSSIKQLSSYCNSIYIKCDFKVKYLENLKYEYGLKVEVTYTNARVIDYYLKSDTFIGNNPNISYYFTQDALFDNISNFDKINGISVKFYAPQEYLDQAKKQISIKNLKISIGKTITNNNNNKLEIITNPHSLDYNDTKNDFSRELDLIWYNRDIDGNFVGFNSQTVVNDRGINETIYPELSEKDNYETIMTDEYAYVAEKKKFNEILALYNTGTCPYDLTGLNLIQKINTVDEIIVNAINQFSKGSEYTNIVETNFNEIWSDLLELISPEKIIENIDSLDFNISQLFSYLEMEKDNFDVSIIQAAEAQSNQYNKSKEMYDLWNSFIALLFYNVHKMQSLEDLELDSLKINEPTNNMDENINLSTIVENILEMHTPLFNQAINLWTIQSEDFSVTLNAYLESCKIPYEMENTESKFNNWTEKVEKLMKQLDELFYDFTMDLKNIVYIYTSKLRDFKNDEDYFSGFFNNSDFIDTINYDESNEDSPYYNLYYYRYKTYKNNMEIEESFPNNYSLIPEEDKFIPEFSVDETTKNKFALYWYEEDLNNLEIDPLLGEDCWTLIDNSNYLTFPEIETFNYGDQKKYYLKKASPFKRPLSITLPSTVKTKDYKVVLYYNHELQGTAEITFNNKSYIDIGFNNSLIDLEYGKTDYRALTGKYNNNPIKLPLSIICYNKEKGREVLTNVQVTHSLTAPTEFPVLQVSPLLIKSNKQNDIKEVGYGSMFTEYGLGREGEINFIFERNFNESFIPFGVYRFKLWLDSKNTISTYHPFAWSLDNPELVLSGAKMVSIDENGKCTYDSWSKEETNPLPYTLTGVENIHDLKYEIYYYKNSGKYEKAEAEKIGMAFSILENNGVYQLSFDIRQARECLKTYRPVLVITGKYGNNIPFVFYQTLFIEYNKYNYDTNTFIDESQTSPVSEFVFIDPNETILAADLKIKYEKGYPIGPNQKITNQKDALEELNRILNDSIVSVGYEYYFNNIAKQVPRDKKVFTNILTGLNNNTINWDTKQSYKVIPDGKTEKSVQTFKISEWIYYLFDELNELGSTYDDDPNSYYSKIKLSYENVKEFLENKTQEGDK